MGVVFIGIFRGTNSGGCSAAACLGLREETDNPTTLLFSRPGKRSQYLVPLTLWRSGARKEKRGHGAAK
jgi:hypothetical protein